MAIYAIGDVQGCFDDLLRLLDKIDFNKKSDQLWFVGDLVNRGPKSLETLRFIKSLGKSAICVLGNHDLHLLAVAYKHSPIRAKDTLTPILDAKDKNELLDWLRHQPLFHYNDDFCLLHAGLPPQWDFATAKKMAAKVEQALRGDKYTTFFKHMHGNKPVLWSNKLTGYAQLRFIVNCFTRMRFCDQNGHLDFKYSGKLGDQPEHLMPWFDLPNRKNAQLKIIFGHWSALGYHHSNNTYAIDTGCLWGGELTALKLGTKMQRISIACKGYQVPNK
ncbi:bis(5'-nucleosyl)-tetraphosphatase (symmetrical) [Bathymodiolus japonicus methanotrophic gill symbiont]|uniref:symmetrical bis(5'-nucleosyl)-tetraphosphatase n=1 Tax=Bathymodiolus japonicus methanotrophic gill symbiont TaxID=113269 RepID=UPI001B7471A5|nr:symmetrical bis(5'-nucleosyl)-tetraphosphatase [Bathymodiolus japonicus methanotrophic gill symbiont]GFO72592.1 bis(5'-nucleosyl)-tetraphosphatase (symmetrical) [Bathymodiolus japonicus methanotrophic gill symbiont]